MFITFLYVLKTLQLLDDKVFKSTDLIFTIVEMSGWCPTNFSGSKVGGRDRNESKQRTRNLPWLHQTFVGEGGLGDTPKECLHGRLLCLQTRNDGSCVMHP